MALLLLLFASKSIRDLVDEVDAEEVQNQTAHDKVGKGPISYSVSYSHPHGIVNYRVGLPLW